MTKLNYNVKPKSKPWYSGLGKDPMAEFSLKIIDHLIPVLQQKQDEPKLKIIFNIRKQVKTKGSLSQKQFALLEKFNTEFNKGRLPG